MNTGNQIADQIARKLYALRQMLTEQIDLGMSGIQRHIAAGQKDHGNVEILNDLCGCRNTLVEDLLSQHIKEGHKHDCDQANTGNVRNVFQNLYNHIGRPCHTKSGFVWTIIIPPFTKNPIYP